MLAMRALNAPGLKLLWGDSSPGTPAQPKRRRGGSMTRARAGCRACCKHGQTETAGKGGGLHSATTADWGIARRAGAARDEACDERLDMGRSGWAPRRGGSPRVELRKWRGAGRRRDERRATDAAPPPEAIWGRVSLRLCCEHRLLRHLPRFERMRLLRPRRFLPPRSLRPRVPDRRHVASSFRVPQRLSERLRRRDVLPQQPPDLLRSGDVRRGRPAVRLRIRRAGRRSTTTSLRGVGRLLHPRRHPHLHDEARSRF